MHNLCGVVDRERRLGHESELRGILNGQRRGILHRLNESDLPTETCIETTERPLHFRVSIVTNEDHVAGLARIAPHFHVHLRHEWTGGIEHVEAAALRFVLNGLRDTVR